MKTIRNYAFVRWGCIVLTCLILLASPTIVSAMVEKLTFAQLVEKADKIVVASVVDVNSHWDEANTLIVTDVNLEIQEKLKGKISEEKMVLQIPGGQVGKVRLDVSDSPSFEIGQEVILFLQGEDMHVVGGFQGEFTVENGFVQGIGVPVDQFSTRIQEIMQAQQAGKQVDFDWEEASLAASPVAAVAPVITSISPTSGPAMGPLPAKGSSVGICASDTTVVTLSGTGFGASQGASYVRFWRDSNLYFKACIKSWSDTKIEARVPGGASSGNVNVITAGGTSNAKAFVVTYSYKAAKWTTNSVSYKINPNTSDLSGEETPVKTAATTWNDVSNGNFTFKYGGASTKSAGALDGENTIYWAVLTDPGIIALTTTWTSNGVISEFDMVFNDSWTWNKDGTTITNMDVQNIATHELGHAFGLLDLYGSADTAKTMYGHSHNGDFDQRSLEPVDIDGMRYIYPCSPPVNGITLYEKSNYAGKCATFTSSDSNLAGNGFSNIASSIQFRGSYASGIQAGVYDLAGYTGSGTTFKASDPDFGNDTIGHDHGSSIKLSAVCPTITAWKGLYWTNKTLSGDALLCRNDSDVNFAWGTGGPGGVIPNDGFSAKWERSLSLNKGYYRFHVLSDDGVRLYLDGILVKDKWINQAPTENTYEKFLSAGNHSITVEYYENTGSATIRFWYESFTGTAMIVARHSVKCMTIAGASVASGINAVQSDCTNGSNQQFIPVTAGSYIKLVPSHSGKCLTVQGASVLDGAKIIQSDCNDGNNQLFSIVAAGSYYKLVAKISGKCLDVPSSSVANGAIIQQWSCTGGGNQLWSGNAVDNLAWLRPASATSQESATYPPSKGNDGNTATRWSSRLSTTLGDEWWWADLGMTRAFNKFTIRWEASYATKYFIGWSADGTNYTGYTINITSAGTYSYNIGPRTGRYIGIHMFTPATCCHNYSFYEFEAYSNPSLSIVGDATRSNGPSPMDLTSQKLVTDGLPKSMIIDWPTLTTPAPDGFVIQDNEPVDLLIPEPDILPTPTE